MSSNQTAVRVSVTFQDFIMTVFLKHVKSSRTVVVKEMKIILKTKRTVCLDAQKSNCLVDKLIHIVNP